MTGKVVLGIGGKWNENKQHPIHLDVHVCILHPHTHAHKSLHHILQLEESTYMETLERRGGGGTNFS